MSSARKLTSLALLLAALGSCDDGKKSRFSEAAVAPQANKAAPHDGVWAARCAAAITELDELPAHERPAALLSACPVCDVETIAKKPFDGSASWLEQLDAAIAACHGYCKPTARKEFLQHIKHDLDSGAISARAWRKLGEDCSAELDVRPDTRAYVGATWFALARVTRGMAQRLPDAARSGLWAQATFPLSALPPEGNGLELATLPAELSASLMPPGRFAVTVLTTQTLVARLPWAKLAAGRIEIDGFYPGDPITDLAAVNAEVTEENPAALFAPRRMPAAHLVPALASLAKPARLAVATTPLLVDYAPPMVLPALLSVRSAPGATVVKLDPSPIDLPAGPLILPLEPTTTVEELAAVVARAGAREIALVLASKVPPAPYP